MNNKPPRPSLDPFNAADRIDLTLLQHRIHFLVGDITEDNISAAIKWITYENLKEQPTILTLYINSHGGELYQAFALIDVMRASKHPIRTVGVGTVMSAAFLILASGTIGERYIAPNTGIMCHQYSDDLTGKHHDIKASMVEADYCNTRMVSILKDATGMTPAKIKSKLLPASDVYLTVNELIQLKVVDHIFQK